jgi:hypothetical protein
MKLKQRKILSISSFMLMGLVLAACGKDELGTRKIDQEIRSQTRPAQNIQPPASAAESAGALDNFQDGIRSREEARAAEEKAKREAEKEMKEAELKAKAEEADKARAHEAAMAQQKLEANREAAFLENITGLALGMRFLQAVHPDPCADQNMFSNMKDYGQALGDALKAAQKGLKDAEPEAAPETKDLLGGGTPAPASAPTSAPSTAPTTDVKEAKSESYTINVPGIAGGSFQIPKEVLEQAKDQVASQL